MKREYVDKEGLDILLNNLKDKLDDELYESPANGYEYVDMGEAGIWAKYPIGVTEWNEEALDKIKYFQWGDIEGYTKAQVGVDKGFAWSDYKWSDAYNHMTKYCNNASYGKDGFVDNLTTLLPEDDACVQNMGGNWRMPTTEEFEMLCNNCNSQWVTNYNGVYGLNGRLFKLKTDETKQLFFSTSGRCEDNSIYGVESLGSYYSSSLIISGSCDVFSLRFGSESVGSASDYRYFGCPVIGFLGSGQ